MSERIEGDDELDLVQDPRVRWIIDEARQPVAMLVDNRARLLEAVRAEPRPERAAPAARGWRWALERRTIDRSPLVSGLLAAGLVGIGVLAGLVTRGRTPSVASSLDAPAARPTGPAAPSTSSTPVTSVVDQRAQEYKFIFVAPRAARVTVVGDFNGWNPEAHPMKRVDGVWTLTLPLEKGRHVYSFVIDGDHWLPDPSAPLAPDDGFGRSNSVALVGGSTS